MKHIELTEEARQQLEQIYQSHAKRQVRERAHSLLLSAQGIGREQIGEIFKRNYWTVCNWFKRWKDHSFEGLYDRAGRGRKPKLKTSDQELVIDLIGEEPRSIDQHLTRIEESTGQKISKSTLKRILRSLGFRWKRIRKWLGDKRNEEEFRRALQELNVLKDLEDKGLIELYYGDESGFTTTPVVPYGWQHKDNPLALSTAKSKRYSLFGLMRRNNMAQVYGFEGSIDTQLAIAFMEDFCTKRQKNNMGPLPKAYVIIDNAPIHNSDDFIEREKEWEEMGVFIKRLPTYSPELNLIEILWRKIKYEWLPLDSYKDYETMVKNLQNVVNGIGKEFVINFG